MSYLTQILSGLGITLSVFFVSLVLSLPLGVIIALLRLSKIKPISKATSFYIWVLRGTPLLLQIMVIFFGLPQIGIRFDRLPAVYIAFVLNYAAYFGEIFRSGIQSIERGQIEAANILGLSNFQTTIKIVLPQVIKRTLPAIGNEVITLVKDTSLVYPVGLNDILRITKGISNREATLAPYFVAGIVYLAMTYIITEFFNRIEKKVTYEE
ncbi:MAG: amino acid ABC transporter permease [Lachnospiraceae bacterium]|nr:amino acid ABC transporter permease [Lachnospiraceae bacterium]